MSLHVQPRIWNKAIVVAVLAAIGYWAVAGDLNPPVGPVGPTMKTLTEVEPRTAINATNTPGDADSLFKITQPGSYYLTGNITGVVGKYGIEIAASGVTLDLNGFDLLGVAGSLDGVATTVASLNNIAVVNGSVRAWGGDGVDLSSLAAFSGRLADLRAHGNAGSGIRAGIRAEVTRCVAAQNGTGGIDTDRGCTITGCTAYANSSGAGISATGGCTVSNCSAWFNTATGISVSSGSTVSNCSAYDNTGSGISTSDGCTVADCSARANTLDGIVCSSKCVIRGNTCSNNGSGVGDGAGVHATSGDNRIEGNNCTSADRGIDVDVAGNFITRNTCSGNTVNWDVAASNKCLVVLGVNAALINGDSGGTGPGSTDPNANFTY